jgi:lysozyme
MKLNPSPLALALAVAAVSAASAQEFSGMNELRAGMRAQTQAQMLIPQAPPMRAMGRDQRAAAGQRVTTDSLVEAAAIPDVSAYPVRGIDISHYEKDVDWNTVKTDGLSFVYIKATEGADGQDDKFAENWKGAESAGLARGAYHFYNFCKGGAVQAANFIKTVPAESGTLPPTVDLEQSGDCKKMPAKAAFRKDLADFVAKVHAAYGQQPIIYVNYSIYDAYFNGENDTYKVWIADIKHTAPAMPDNSSWTMWQYGWHGSVAGITGDVDLDVFNGTPQMLASLEGPSDVMVARAP